MDKNSLCFIGLLWKLNKIMCLKYIARYIVRTQLMLTTIAMIMSQDPLVGLGVFILTVPHKSVLCVCDSLQGCQAGKRKLFICVAEGDTTMSRVEVDVRSNFIAEEC